MKGDYGKGGNGQVIRLETEGQERSNLLNLSTTLFPSNKHLASANKQPGNDLSKQSLITNAKEYCTASCCV